MWTYAFWKSEKRHGSTAGRLYLRQAYGLFQRFQRIPCGHEFVRVVAGKLEIGDGPCDSPPVEFLRIVQFVPPRVAARMKVADPLDVLPDRPDDVSFHDLHVIDVVQQLHPR